MFYSSLVLVAAEIRLDILKKSLAVAEIKEYAFYIV